MDYTLYNTVKYKILQLHEGGLLSTADERDLRRHAGLRKIIWLNQKVATSLVGCTASSFHLKVEMEDNAIQLGRVQ